MYILLDMHAAPGYQNPGDHSDNGDSNASQPRTSVKFWDGTNVATAAKIWKHIATRYKNEPIIWGYDLINEPVTQETRKYELLPSLIAMRNAIREVDNNHIIVAEGDWWGSDLVALDWNNSATKAATGVSAAWDNNLVLQTHHYIFGNTAWLADLYARDDITNAMNVPLILGEYGEDSQANLRTMADWSAANIAGAFAWSFKKMSHDKTLWTIKPNALYSSVVAYINNGGTKPANAYQGMIDFAKNNIANGAPGLVWHQDFYEGTKPSCNTKAPGSLQATAISPNQINMNWLDNASNEDGYGIKRDGQSLTTLAANSKTFSDYGLMAQTCYDYEVTTLSSCNSSAQLRVCTPCAGTRTPYTGAAAAVPGVIEAENFDLGCQGVTYNDTTSGNNGGALRSTDVDIATTVDNGQNDFNIGWVAQGEWLEYTVNVQQAGNYDLSYRVATPQTSGQIQLFAKGTLLSTTNIPATGGWETWASVNAGRVSLTAGEQILRVYFSGPEVNLNAFSLSPAQASSSESSIASSKSSVPSSKSSVPSSKSSAPSSTPIASSKSSASSSKSSLSSSLASSSSANDQLISGATYVLLAKHSGKALDVRDNSTSNGASIQQWSYGGGANQQWVITKINASQYKIISKHSGKALDVKDLSLTNGGGIQQWDYQGGTNQLWTITELGGGDYSIISVHSGKALDVSNAANDNGASVHQWTYQGATNQRWLLTAP